MQLLCHYASKQNVPVARRQVCAVELQISEFEDNLQEEAKIHPLLSSPAKFKCWKCEEVWHVWENCLAARYVFCYK